jgi:alkylation response protein AidB-like acyl-CoA dehydrogenase
METMIRSMRLFVYDAASLMGKKSADEAHLACALMKRYVPDAATTVASKALQVFGGRGYTDEERVGRIWRDCRGNQIAQGADEIMTKLASKFITKRAMM